MWVNARYYRAFVVPPGCPDQQQLQAFADPEQSLHIHNMHTLGNFTDWDTASPEQAAHTQHFLGAFTHHQTGPEWTGQGYLPSTTHPGIVSQCHFSSLSQAQ
jgi:hypothetical protein